MTVAEIKKVAAIIDSQPAWVWRDKYFIQESVIVYVDKSGVPGIISKKECDRRMSSNIREMSKVWIPVKKLKILPPKAVRLTDEGMVSVKVED